MADDRRYDDREVGLILKRVAELHEGAGEGADGRAMTRAEIEEVVTELGIPKALVARAVSEVSVQDVRNRPVWWLGGKTDVMFEETVDGAIDDATLTRMLEVLRRHLGDPGELTETGGARIWSTKNSARTIHFSVVQSGDRTTLRLEERMPVDASTTVGLATVGGGVTGFMGMVPLKALVLKSVLLLAMGPLVLSGALLGWLGGRMLWRRTSGGRDEALRRMFGEIVVLAQPGPLALAEAE